MLPVYSFPLFSWNATLNHDRLQNPAIGSLALSWSCFTIVLFYFINFIFPFLIYYLDNVIEELNSPPKSGAQNF